MTAPGFPDASPDFRPVGHPVATRRIVSLVNRARQKLTKRVAEGAEAGPRYTISDAMVPGFGLRVTAAGTKTFILRYRSRGRSSAKRYVTLGRYGIVTVEEARDSARRLLEAVAGGQDPVKAAATSRATPTLEDVTTEFLSAHVDLKRKSKTAASYRHALLHHVLPRLGRGHAAIHP